MTTIITTTAPKTVRRSVSFTLDKDFRKGITGMDMRELLQLERDRKGVPAEVKHTERNDDLLESVVYTWEWFEVTL